MTTLYNLLDGRYGRTGPEENYLDFQERLAAEERRAIAEGRAADTENPPATAGTPLVPYSGLPITFATDPLLTGNLPEPVFIDDVPTNVLTADTVTPVHDAAVVFTATLAYSGTPDAPVTGTVTFKEGSTTLGSGVISGEVATYNHAAGFAAGAHTITAHYSGNSSYDPVVSTGLVVTASA